MSVIHPRLRVATYNVHACVGTDGRPDPSRVASVDRRTRPDIVALQEFTYPASVALETRQPVVSRHWIVMRARWDPHGRP